MCQCFFCQLLLFNSPNNNPTMDSDTETKDTSRRVNKVIVDSDEDEQAEQVEHQETHDDKESDDDIGLFGDEDENDNLFDDE